MKKRVFSLVISISIIACMISGCSLPGSKKETVNLTVWGAEDSQEILKKMVDEFEAQYGDEADFHISVGEQGEDTLRKNIEDHPERAADVFALASDQLQDLCKAGILLEVTNGKDEIIKENGGKDDMAVKCAMYNDKLYAYPMTASNGYFLYYNAKYFSEDDVKSLDRILEVAEKNDKYFSMDWTSGWYIYSFFGGAGMNVVMNENKDGNVCDFNRTTGKYTGVDVANAMMDICSHKSFKNTDDAGFREGIEEGFIIAGVNGTWNSKKVEEVFGDDYRAVKLPTYTIKGAQVQMASFSGYKMLGVNAYSENTDWAQKLAKWLTNEQNQLLRFEATGEGPSNVNASNSEEVKKAVAISALKEQSDFSIIQNVTESYWQPTTVFGALIVAGNPDNRDLQEVLDDMVSDISH